MLMLSLLHHKANNDSLMRLDTGAFPPGANTGGLLTKSFIASRWMIHFPFGCRVIYDRSNEKHNSGVKK